MPIEVPEGWQSGRLGQFLAAAQGGGTPPRDNPAYWGRGLPWASVKDVTSGAKEPLEAITAEGLENSSSRRVSAGTNILATRMAVGTVIRYGVDVAINQDLLALLPANALKDDFLFHWLRHHSASFAGVATGTTVKGLRKDVLLDWPIYVPPLDEQRRIAEVLRSVDETVAKERALLGQYQTAYSSIMSAFLSTGNGSDDGLKADEWITGRIKAVHRIPRDWRIRRLVEVAKLESGHTPSRSVEAYWEGGDIGWISLHDTKNLEQREIQETTLNITAAGVANSSARILPQGTVCLSRTATVGKCVIMGKPMTTSQDFANFVCSPTLNNRYLLHLFRWMGPIWKALSSGSTHKTIYMPTFEALQIIVPPVEAQESVAAALDAIASAIELSSEHLEALSELRASVSSDLLSGRVRVPA